MSFPSLRNTVSHLIRNLSEHSSKTQDLSLLLLLSIRARSITSSSRYCSQNHSSSSSSSSFVVSYLINSCGLAENEAISASKKVHFMTTSKPDSVVSLLESYGFTKRYMCKLITKRPSLLSSDPEVHLKPKFDFLKSKGICGVELAKFISADPCILNHSLETQLIPRFDNLRSLFHTDQVLIANIKRYPILLRKHLNETIMLNIELLKNLGVSEHNICRFLVFQYATMSFPSHGFMEIVQQVKRMEFDPSQIMFLLAIHVLTGSTSTWETKMNMFRGLGWSEDKILNAFKKHPQCMITSKKKVLAINDFLVNHMGYTSSIIAACPSIFCYSLEKRIKPRCSVYRILISNNLI